MRFTIVFVAAGRFLTLAGAIDNVPISGSLSTCDEAAAPDTDADFPVGAGSEDIPEVSPVTGIGGYPAGGACNGCGDLVKKCLAVCRTGPSKDCDSFCSCSLTSDPKSRCRYLGT
jgi:hypothetical protein